MTRPLVFHDDRLFPADERTRGIARALYGQVKALPIISPHGHTDPDWFATNAPFPNATELLLAPDHYLYRMLYSQGVSLDAPGRASRKAAVQRPTRARPGGCWRQNMHLFRGTPSSHLAEPRVRRGVRLRARALSAETADALFRPHQRGAGDATAFRPRALFDRFNIELMATTEGRTERAGAPQGHPRQRLEGPGGHRLSPRPGGRLRSTRTSHAEIERFGEISGQDVHGWSGYLEAHRIRRRGVHGRWAPPRPTTAIRPPQTADLSAGRGRGAVPQGARAGIVHARPTPSCSAPRC